MAAEPPSPTRDLPPFRPADETLPSWVVGLCGVAAVASLLFSVLLFLHR